MQLNKLTHLPIDQYIPDIIHDIQQGCNQILVKATPGSGKTTRIPPALMTHFKGKTLVLEPRRLAAKMSASRVIDELKSSNQYQENICGWQMRHDSNFSNSTKLLFITEGVFPLKVAEDPKLSDISCIVLDEFHERHAETDIALALALKIQKDSRPDLVIIIMSATLDIPSLTKALPQCKIFEVTTPMYPIQIEWWKGDYQKSLIEKTIEVTVRAALDQNSQGNILVFLPGSYEIRKCAEAVKSKFINNQDFEILELRGSLDKEDQEKVYRSSSAKKIIFSTDIAESSLTIPGVTTVVDSGLARTPTFDHMNQQSVLETKPVCKASVVQRTGRAGRTAPGRVIRLFSESDYAGRPEAERPEILRTDLAPILMTLLSLDKSTKLDWSFDSLTWLDSPPQNQWQTAKDLLSGLGFLGEASGMIESEVKRIPLHPRLAKFLLICKSKEIGPEGCLLSAILESPDSLIEIAKGSEALGCDLLAKYEVVRSNIQNPRYKTIKNTAMQLQRILAIPKRELKPPHELELEQPLIAAFFDRVCIAQKQSARNKHKIYSIVTGGDAELSESSAAQHFDWIIAWSSDRSKISGSVQDTLKKSFFDHSRIKILGASGIELSSLKKFAPKSYLKDTSEVVWDEATSSVKTSNKLMYGQLLISETKGIPTQDLAQEIFREVLLEKWPAPFESDQDLWTFIHRVELLNKHGFLKHKWSYEELKELIILHLCDYGSSFVEIKKRTLSEWLSDIIGTTEWDFVERMAPSKLKIGAGFWFPVHYESGKPPWLEARLQNFFGQMKTPQLLEGKVPLTLHLLAPNQVALQITTDLESFWSSTYPQLRNEYMRKYPRHYWPENPKDAEPPVRGSLKPRTQK